MRVLSIVGLLLLLSAATLNGSLLDSHRGGVALAMPDHMPEPDGIVSLTQGETITRENLSSRLHSYRIALTRGQYLRMTARPADRGVELAVYDAGGRLLSQLGCRSRGATPISVIAESSGDYRLEVRPRDETAAGAGYELRIAELRQATAKDRDRIAAEKLCAEAEQLSQQSTSASSLSAIGKYEEAITSWKVAGDLREEADALLSIGSIYQVLGELRQSEDYYDRAIKLYRKVRDRWDEGEALNELSWVYYILGDNEKNLKICTRALKINQATGNRHATARALNNLGDVYYNYGRFQSSQDNYNKSLSMCRELNDRHGEALSLLCLGYDYSDLGEMQKAFDCFNQALSIWQSRGDKRFQGITLTAMGRRYTRMGESQNALNLFNRAREIIESVGDRIEQGRILSGIAYVYYLLDEQQQALDYYDRALRFYEGAGYLSAQADMFQAVGNIYYSMKDYEKTFDYYQRALSLSIAINNMRGRSNALRGIGTVYQAWGNKAKALDYYARALSFYQKQKAVRSEAETLNMIGQIHDESGQKQKALYYYNKALERSRAAEYRFGEASMLYNIACVERDLGKLSEARARIETALETVESLRTKVIRQDLRNSYFASVRQHYELYIDLLMRLHAQQPTAGFDVLAFEASERALARSLLETLTAARVGLNQKVDPALLERERLLREELNGKAANRMRLLNAEHTLEQKAAIEREIEELTRRHQELESQIRAASLDQAGLIKPQPLNLKTIQRQAIDDDTILLEYSLGEQRSYLWAVTKTGLTSYELPGRAKLEELSYSIRDILTAPQFIEVESYEERQARLKESASRYWQGASALSKAVLGGAARELGTKRMIIVADGALQYVPFSALPDPESGDGDPAPLVLRHEITCQPSASSLAALRAQTQQRASAANLLAVFADPVFEKDDPRLSGGKGIITVAAQEEQPEPTELHRVLRGVGALGDGEHIPRLFASREEAEAATGRTPDGLALKATGFDASKSLAISAELRQYRIIHFATHGILDSENPDLSGLVLSLYDKHGQPQDGFLRLNDIYNLELPADLVVLSACNTGLGKQVKGEGLIGLTRGFMYAGAARVMASLWKVDDEATAQLIKYFYDEMLLKKKSPAEALRQAQVAMWNQKRWHSPYFWAAFVLQGEYRGEITADAQAQKSAPKLFMPVMAVTLMFCIGIYTARQIRLRKRRAGLNG